MVPVDHVLVHVVEAHVLLQVFHAFLGGLQEHVFAGQHEGRGHAVDHARDGVRLLSEGICFALAAQADCRAILLVVDVTVAKLGAYKEVADALSLVGPPRGFLEAEFARLSFREVYLLGLEGVLPVVLRVEDAEDEGHASVLRQQLVQVARGILVGFVQVAHQAGKGGVGQQDRERALVGGGQREASFVFIEITHISGNQVGELELHLVGRFEYIKVVFHK